VDDVTLSIYQGEFFSLLGPSGCGKTTLLSMLAGLEMPTRGKIFIDGVDVTRRPAYDRPVNMMFQSYALFPHMTVEQNVAFGLKQERRPKAEIRERVKEALKLVQMEKYGHRSPHQLSGGQRQRVALARSLVKRPKLLLLDEPLAALDKRLREQTQFELVSIQEEVGITFILVTHDQEEAMTMSSRLGIMDHGRLRQIGPPNEIYEYPHSEYVADFIGSINKFEGRVIEVGTDHILVDSEEAGGELYVSHSPDAPVGSQVKVAIRPEKIMISTVAPKETRNVTKGVVRDIAYLGDVSIYHVELESEKVILATQPNLVRLAERPVTWDDEVYLFWRAENSIVLTA
jgi:putrescine transport system ATP-binding protein